MQSDIKMVFYSTGVNLRLIDYINEFYHYIIICIIKNGCVRFTHVSLILVKSIVRFFAIFLIRLKLKWLSNKLFIQEMLLLFLRDISNIYSPKYQ